MRRTLIHALLVVGALLAPAAVRAQAKPINLALFNPVQIVDDDTSIHGFRFNLLYGYNQEMHGFDLGLVNRARGSVLGMQWGVANWGESSLTGLQASPFVNYLEGDAVGAQVGAVNIEKAGTGLQFGAVNYAPRIEGLQFGFVNITDQLKGLQLGLVNVARNGFLPVFVFFNFAFD